jgi:hypothetical protein
VVEDDSKETLLATCEHYEATVAGVVEASYQRYIDGLDCSFRWSLLSCPACQSPILVSQDDEDSRYDEEAQEAWSKPKRLYPLPSDRQLGFAVLEPIRTAFAEARACYTEARTYTACASMCRNVLEGVESHGATSGSLAQRLRQLSETGQLDKLPL